MAGFELKTAWFALFFAEKQVFMSKQAFAGKQTFARKQSSGTGF
jgi:hypothetical protein